MHRKHIPVLPALLTLITAPLSPPLAAQILPEGYASHVEPLPAGSGSTLVLPQGVVWFTGTELVLRERMQTRPLLRFAQPVFGSFTLAVGPDAVLFGENSTGDLWLVPLQGPSTPRVIANVPFNFDALHYAPGLVLVSAKTGGFTAARNDVVSVDLHTGAVVPRISVAGASGPLEQDAVGNLYYATGSSAFPPPPGATDVLRFDATRILAGGRVLTEADAAVVHRGLDAAGDIALDDDGDLFFVDWSNGTVGEVDDLGSGAPATVLVDYSGLPEQPATLQLIAGGRPGQPPGDPARGTFEPFQPAAAGSLAMLESSFGSTSRLRYLTPRRPLARPDRPGPIPAGAFQVIVEHGPSSGTGLIAVNGFSAGREFPLGVPGFEQPLLWDLGMFGPVNTHPVAFDAAGRSVLSLHNPGFPAGLQFAVQAAVLDAGARVLGSSAVAAPLLGQ